MEDGEDVVEQVLHTQAPPVQVVLGHIPQVGASLLSPTVHGQALLTEPGGEES